jgi:monoterpene epsilon-lactone hydrolase
VSLQNRIAKLYVRLVFRDKGPFDPLKTQSEFNVPDPPRGISKRALRLDHDRIRGFWIDKQNVDRGVLIYLHGGAFYFGPVKEHWQYLAHICKQTEMAGLMIDYSFAPQHPFPEGLNEVVEIASTIDLPENWFFVGDSSGAGLAVSALFELRRLNRRLPKKLVLMSPWLDVTLTNPAIEENKHDDVMMTVERLSSAAQVYVGDTDPRNPLISPMFGDLAGLPPMLVQMGTADLLLADCRKFVEKCQAAGVDVKYEEVPHVFHDFMMLNILPEAKLAIVSQTEFLNT